MTERGERRDEKRTVAEEEHGKYEYRAGHRMASSLGRGDQQALHELVPAVERELNRNARRCLAGERPNRSVSATALVNETFLRLVELRQIDW